MKKLVRIHAPPQINITQLSQASLIGLEVSTPKGVKRYALNAKKDVYCFSNGVEIATLAGLKLESEKIASDDSGFEELIYKCFRNKNCEVFAFDDVRDYGRWLAGLEFLNNK